MLTILALFCVSFLPARALNERVLISEIKLGGAVAGQPTQFVELFNDSAIPIDLAGWSLEYAKVSSTISSSDCSSPDWKAIDLMSGKIIYLGLSSLEGELSLKLV